MDDPERRRAELLQAANERLPALVEDIEFATRGEPVDLEEQVRRVYVRAASPGEAEKTTKSFRPPRSDRDVERARLRAVLVAIEAPVARLRDALFTTTAPPFRTWAQAVTWIQSESMSPADVRAIEAAAEPQYEAFENAFDAYCDANPFTVRAIETRDSRFFYLDANGRPRTTSTMFGSPLQQLWQRCEVWAGVTWISEGDLLRLVLVGDTPKALRGLRVSRRTAVPSVPFPADPQLLKHVVAIEIDVRDVTHRTFVNAFKRTREFLGLGKQRKTARDEREAELRETVARLGGPSTPGIWKDVCRAIPRLRKKTPDAARKAYTRLLKADRGRRSSTHRRGTP